MSDEAVEETLDKVSLFSAVFNIVIELTADISINLRYWFWTSQVVKLLAYISDKDLFAEFYRHVFMLLSLIFLFCFTYNMSSTIIMENIKLLKIFSNSNLSRFDFFLLLGKSFLDVYCLTRVLMMIMKDLS